ncbi:T9SS type A sorting domain-containing protein, partial [Fulvivirga sp. RKSG066]|uniref:LamG-like jellyroll fold domain-containing protein n=1 Tax=Fulvivirga aurantia TaxID=2529383 RepID=UPI0012BCF3FF
VDYYLRNDADDSIIDGPIAGTGSAISLNTGSISSTTTYNVYSEAGAKKALDFDGTDDKVDLGALDLAGETNVTLEAWINTDLINVSHDGIISKTDGDGQFIFRLENGKPRSVFFTGTGDLGAISTQVLNTGTWYHVAATYDGVESRIYVDGIDVTGTQYNNSASGGLKTYTASPVTIGRANGPEHFDGKIGDVRVWNVLKTPAEIAANMETDYTGTEPNLVALYKMNDGSGSTVTDATGSFNGTMVNMDPATDWISYNVACTLEMTQTATVTINPIANQTVTAAETTLCPNTGTTVEVASTQSGVNYYLRDDVDNKIIDGPVLGTGSAISFNTGSISNTTTFNVLAQSASISGALRNDGINNAAEYAEVTGSPLNGLTSFTVEFWVKQHITTSPYSIVFGHAPGSAVQLWLSPDGAIYMRDKDNTNYATVAGVFPYNDGDWHHVAVVWNNATAQGAFYVDGANAALSPSANTFEGFGTQGNLQLGSHASYYASETTLDEFRIWSVAKSEAEIQAKYMKNLDGTEADLIAYYNFENGTGSTAVSDVTGNGWDASLVNIDPSTDWVSRSSVTCEQEMTTSVTVTVEDNIAPVADATSLADLTNECSVAAPTAPTATDNCAGSITGVADVTFPITTQGTTVVTWSFDDGNGNVSTQTQNVIIDDVTAPVPDVATLSDITDECAVPLFFYVPTATDNCGGSISATTTSPMVIDTQGTTVVTWTYDDGNGNITTQTQNVIIDDVTAPVADQTTLPDLTGECSVAEPTAPTASDNCGPTIEGVADVTFPVTASTTITWTYDDGNGNISTQTQNVVIDDATAPVADAGSLADLTDECSVAAPIAPTATDNCEGSIVGVADVTFPITAQGTTVVTWTFDDGNGNVSTQTQNVVITDATAPTADELTLQAVTAECSLNTVAAPTATDNCEGTIEGTTEAVFPITASTTITWSYDDGNGNVSTQTQEVIITETVWYADVDGDGFGDAAVTLAQCEQPTGYVADNTDCDDTDADVYPGAPAKADGKDNDCDGEVDKVTQKITFQAIEDKFLEEESVELVATATSGLDVVFTVVSGPAAIEGSTLTFTGTGEVTVEASQSGDDRYLPSQVVTQTFEVMTVTGLGDKMEEASVRLYPNPASDVITVSNIRSEVKLIRLIGMKGQVLKQIESPQSEVKIDVSDLKNGTYMLIINDGATQLYHKLFKK